LNPDKLILRELSLIARIDSKMAVSRKGVESCFDCGNQLEFDLNRPPVFCIVMFGKDGAKDTLVCETCGENGEVQRCCKCGHKEPNVELRVLQYCDFDDEMNTMICPDCHEEERKGKCSSGVQSPGWDGSYVTTHKCTKKARFEDPPCCGKDVSCDRCVCMPNYGCTHENHPSYMECVDGIYLCRWCKE